MVAVLNSLIELDAEGVPWITGANTKVVEVVLDQMAVGARKRCIVSILIFQWRKFTPPSPTITNTRPRWTLKSKATGRRSTNFVLASQNHLCGKDCES